jgi:hypothetical protein
VRHRQLLDAGTSVVQWGEVWHQRDLAGRRPILRVVSEKLVHNLDKLLISEPFEGHLGCGRVTEDCREILREMREAKRSAQRKDVRSQRCWLRRLTGQLRSHVMLRAATGREARELCQTERAAMRVLTQVEVA